MRTVKEPDVRRLEILEAAKRLFLKQTYDTTTTNDVMCVLGIAKGTIYHYFPSKDHLLDAVVEHMAEAYVTRRLEAVEACTGGALAKMRVLFNRDARNPEERSATASLHQAGNVTLHTRLLVSLVQRLAPVFAQLIRDGCAEGVFRTEHPLEVAEILLSGIQFLTDEGVHPWSTVDRTRRLRAVPTLVETLLAAKAGSFAFLDPGRAGARRGRSS